MKKLFLLLALWCVPAFAQGPATPQKDSTGNITSAGTTCATTKACVNIHLASNVSGITVTTTGTFTATGTAESSADNGTTWTSQGTITTATVTNFTPSAWTDFRIRASAYTSGTMAVFINTSTASVSGGGLGPVTLTGTPNSGDLPTATSATTATWQAPAAGSGTVTHTGALTANQLVFGNGTADIAVGNLTGDATTSGGKATTVVAINGTSLGGLATGLLKNTTTTGVPSIASASDILTACTGCAPLASPTFTGTVTEAALSATGIATFSQAGALSASAFNVTGAPIATGGTGTTTLPLVYINSGASAPTTWSTAGTVLGINTPSGSTSNFLDFHINGGASIFKVASTGATTFAATLTASNLGVSGGISFTSANSHINTQAATTDLAGTIAISSSTSGTKTFSAAYTNAPNCVITPTSDPTASGTWWVTTSTTTVTANVSISGTISFKYICVAATN